MLLLFWLYHRMKMHLCIKNQFLHVINTEFILIDSNPYV